MLNVATGNNIPYLGFATKFKGEQPFAWPRDELQLLSEPFKNSLIECFPLGRPSMEILRKFIASLGLLRECSVGLLDEKHVLLKPQLEEDFTRL